MGTTPYQHDLAVAQEASGGMAEYAGASPQGGGAGHLLIALRHHWLIAVLAWPLLVGIAVPAVWFTQKPEYTATAQLKVDPIMSSLLDNEMRTMPLFDSYLASQAHLMNSGPVLMGAMGDPKLKGLALLDQPDAVGSLRRNLTVAPVPRTQIIRVSVTDQDRNAAIQLADAVLNSYLVLYGGTTEIDLKLDFLGKRETDLKRALDDLRRRRRTLADEYKASTDSMFEKLRELEAKRSEQILQNIESVTMQIRQTEQEIERVLAGTDIAIGDDDPVRQREAIENHPLVRSLREHIRTESDQLVRLRRGLSDEAPAVIQTLAQIEKLKTQMEQEQAKASEEYLADQVKQQERMKATRLATLKAKLESAKQIRDDLEVRRKEQEDKDRRMGQYNIDIQAVQEQMEKVQKDLAEVEDARKKLELEKSQPGPGRVSKASSAEVLPDGYKDKRIKLTGAAVVGCLFAALGLSLLRGKMDSRVYVPDQVESGAGLRILGVVPAISELKRGRVAQEDFAEAYRLVRVNVLTRAAGEPPKSILVTSAHSGEGKTSLAVSLAASLAELGGRVLLIDGDVQAPSIGLLLGIDGPGRLRHVLCGERKVAEAAVPSRLAHLDVLLGGMNGDGARGLIDQNSADHLVAEASRLYDYVVVDSSPALGTADAAIWSQAVDSVVLSTLAGYSDLGATRRLCDRLAMVGARILGAVVCNVTLRSGYSSYSTFSSNMSRAHSRGGDKSHAAYILPNMADAGKEEADSKL